MDLTEPAFRAHFPPPFNTKECKLLDICTNELGLLLQSDGKIPTALVGNPLRPISFNEIDASQKSIAADTAATSVAVNCSQRYVSLTAAASLRIYDLQKGSILRELHEHDGVVNSVNWHRESPWLLASVGADCTLRLWDLRSHPAQISIRRSIKSYSRLEFSPDCNYIACAGELVSIFDLTMAQNVVHMLSNSPAVAVRFNPAECLLATAGDDRTVRFWDIDTGECITQSPAFDAQIGHICFDSEGKYLIVGTEKQIASIHWEPFELLSQLNYTQQLNFQSPKTLPTRTENGGRSTLLDMRICKDQLHQLVVSESPDPMKRAVIGLASLSLHHFEKCGTLSTTIVDKNASHFCDNEVGGAQEKEEDNETSVTASTPGSILDSLIFEQDEELQKTATEPQSSDSTKMKSPFKSRPRPPMALKSDGSSLPSKCESEPRRNRQKATEGGAAATPSCRRPDTFRNSLNPKSLIRRGISLTDVTNCASNSSAAVPSSSSSPHPNPATMPISSVAMAKNRSHSQFSSSTASSSSNASSNSSNASSSSADPGPKRRSESEVRSLEEFLQVDPKIKASVTRMKGEAKNLLSSLSSVQENKAEYIVREAAHFEDPHLFAKILQNYMRQQPRAHTLAMVAAFLPRVDALLKHRNNAYPPLAVDFLEMVLASFGDSIRHGLASRDFSIGVDVAAEQRFDRCTKCKNALLQIRLNSAFCVERLDSELRRRFENLMTLIDNLVSHSH